MGVIESQKKSPYHGIWIVILISILIPLILYLVFYSCISQFFSLSKELDIYSALGFSTLVTTLFHISCMIAGLWNETFSVVRRRIKDLFNYYPLIKKKAFEKYLDDIKNDGVSFWIYLFIFLVTLVVCIISTTLFFKAMT